MGHGLSDLFRNDGGEGEGEALRAGRADHTLFAGEGVEKIVVAAFAAPVGEARLAVPAALEGAHGGLDRVGAFGIGGLVIGPISIKHRPNRGGARMAETLPMGDGHHSIPGNGAAGKGWDEARGRFI